MKKAVIKFLLTIGLFVAFFMLQKVLFMLSYHKLMPYVSLSDRLAVIWHGLPMDLSVTGYLTAIPALMITASVWVHRRWLDMAMKIYFAIVAILLSAITLLDLELYAYWGFRLDMTPLFYFTTSPSAALASASTRQIILGIMAIGLCAYGLYKTFSLTVCRIKVETPRPKTAAAVMLLLTASLFIPIRGGVTVSTMNLSRAYFSHDKMLNHAAINPAFSLLYSATHQNDFGAEYNFMTPDEMEAQIKALDARTSVKDSQTQESGSNNTTSYALTECGKPDIYLIILESFSAHLMPSLGGESIAVKLDSIARNGVSFTNFYANSFRTDRALPSILSGFPAQPSMSLLKYVEKAEALPSLAGELKKAGYRTAYYYGGDINFANINAYLVSGGYDKIVCDKDFPIAERTSKWGAHDHLVFNRASDDALSNTDDAPRFTVIQTSSSHEPFDVPFSSPEWQGHPQKNAFAYTDNCLDDFLNRLKRSPRYGCTLAIIVPDHLGAWPLELPEAAQRHHVPLVITGGALKQDAPKIIDTPGAQTDIAATLLGIAGKDASAFPFSKNLLDPAAPRYAVFTEPSLIGIVTDTDTLVYNCDARRIEESHGTDAESLVHSCQAYLQATYKAVTEL